MENKIVVITGASRGLGKCIAQAFIAKKATVTISARDSSRILENTAKEIGATAIVADVTKEADLVSLAQQVFAKFGKIDVWVNNAGVWFPSGPLEQADMIKAHEVFEVNVFGMIYGMRAALTCMNKQQSGTIVNIVSTAALYPRPNSAIYSSSKHALKGVTDAVREETKDRGISVIGIYPGGIKTDLFKGDKPREYDQFLEPEYVAEKIVENLSKVQPETELILKRPGQGIKP